MSSDLVIENTNEGKTIPNLMKSNDTTVVRLINTGVGHSVGQTGAFLSAGAGLLVVYLVTGGAISTAQYGLHLIVKELNTNDTNVIFSPLLNMSIVSALKIGAGSIVSVLVGGGLRKLGTGMTNEHWITYWEGIFYRR